MTNNTANIENDIEIEKEAFLNHLVREKRRLERGEYVLDKIAKGLVAVWAIILVIGWLNKIFWSEDIGTLLIFLSFIPISISVEISTYLFGVASGKLMCSISDILEINKKLGE